jgi:hypothetical protein
MSQSRPSFPVSRPQGMGNRGTGANVLANHDLLSPGPLKSKRGCGKQKASRATVWDATDPPTASSVASLKIERIYQPESTAMEALVDVLLLFLVGAPESIDSPQPEPTCFRRPPE